MPVNRLLNIFSREITTVVAANVLNAYSLQCIGLYARFAMHETLFTNMYDDSVSAISLPLLRLHTSTTLYPSNSHLQWLHTNLQHEHHQQTTPTPLPLSPPPTTPYIPHNPKALRWHPPRLPPRRLHPPLPTPNLRRRIKETVAGIRAPPRMQSLSAKVRRQPI